MKDRLPTKVLPNGAVRYGVYDDRGALLRYEYMLAADDPSEAGTPLSVATLLQDATAALFGLNAAAVPNDVLNWIGQYNTHWWSVLHGRASFAYDEIQTDITDRQAIYVQYYTTEFKTVTYASAITISQTDGSISLKNPTTVTPTASTSGMTSLANTLKGKYLLSNSKIYYVPANATVGTSTSYTLYYENDESYGYSLTVSATTNASSPKVKRVTSQLRNIPAGEITYVHSTNRNAYTEGTDASGNVYEYLGVPFTKATTAPKIATGTYVGTGMAGPSNPNTLTFDFSPKLVVVQSDNYSNMNFVSSGMRANWVLLLNGVNEVRVAFSHSNVSSSPLAVNWSGNTVSWYHDETNPYDNSQLNSAGQTYRYFAIG